MRRRRGVEHLPDGDREGRGLTPAPAPPAAPAPGAARRRALTALTLTGWLGLLTAARLRGQYLIDSLGRDALRLSAPPFVGWDDVELNPRTLVPIVVAVLVVAAAPTAARRLTWRQLLVATWAATAAFAVAVGAIRGWHGLTYPLVLPNDEYLLQVSSIDSPGEFLRTFTEQIGGFVVHVKGHPPGFVLLLWALDRIGLGGTGPAAVLVIGGGSSATAAVLVSVRSLVDEDTARRAAPFLVLAPATLWIATTADAFYAGVAAWAIAAFALATARDRGRRRLALAVLAGLGFGATLLFSYGLVLVGLFPVAIAIRRRSWDLLAVAAAGTLAVPLAFAAAGFNYLDGWAATREQYELSVASTRPYSYFVWSNLAAFAAAIGPAVVVALTRLRDRRLWLLVGAALGAVVLADLSGLSKGEVERIWIPFAVWVLAAGSVLDRDGHPAALRSWLGLQATVAIALETFVHTRW